MYRYRNAFGYLLRTLCWMGLFYLLLEYGFSFAAEFLQLNLDGRLKAFAFLLGLNLIAAFSLPATFEEIKRIREESRFNP
ncbi:hypothetical protein NT239_13905 [Chitinibacter sp. SCUT-21]|uniref:hypothetical protein n=1 Tax=Chitinibacter sp. SCUT-21 TaxID=2970891 RepID=UPI0035A643B6